jgi:hypothetical protein
MGKCARAAGSNSGRRRRRFGEWPDWVAWGAVVYVDIACVDQTQQHAIEKPAEILRVLDSLQLAPWRNGSPVGGVVSPFPGRPLGFAELKFQLVEDVFRNRLMRHTVHPAGRLLEKRLSAFGDSELFDQPFDCAEEVVPSLAVVDDFGGDLLGEALRTHCPERFDDGAEMYRSNVRRGAACVPEAPVEIAEPEFVVCRLG